MALAACYVKVDNDVKRALETLEQAKSELKGQNLPAEVMVSALIRDIQTLPKLEALTPSKGPLRALEYVKNRQDWLVTPAYLSLVFITTFLPCIRTSHVDPTTPIIRRRDLESAADDQVELAKILTAQGDHYSIVRSLVEGPVEPRKPSPRRFPSRRKRAIRGEDWTPVERGRYDPRNMSLPGHETERLTLRTSVDRRRRLRSRRGLSREGEGDMTPLQHPSEIVDLKLLPDLPMRQIGLQTAHIERLQDISIDNSPRRESDLSLTQEI